jgi:hypothetical protein
MQAEQAPGYPGSARLLAVGLALGVAAGMGGCTVGETPAPQISAGAETGACMEPKPGDPNLVKKAERCLQVMRSGKVLLVDFGAPEGMAKTAAEKLPDTISTYTAGNVTLSFKTVEATPEAKAAYKATLTDKGCADPKQDPAKYGGSIADKLMPKQTKGADFVLGLSSEVACRPNTAGLANSAKGRYADVYMGDYKKALANADPKIRESVVRTGRMLTAHELMHLFGLGHAGSIKNSGDDLSATKYWLGAKLIKLDDYVKGAEYDAYDDITNVMASGRESNISSGQTNSRLDIDFLNWPKYATGQAANPGRKLQGQEFMFELGATDAGQYASVKLKQPIQMHSASKGKTGEAELSPVKFTDLALVPLIGKNGNYGVDLVLISGKTIATLGSINPEDPRYNATSVIELGGIKVEVRTQGKRTFIRQVTGLRVTP